jgi:hypothetical protein
MVLKRIETPFPGCSLRAVAWLILNGCVPVRIVGLLLAVVLSTRACDPLDAPSAVAPPAGDAADQRHHPGRADRRRAGRR